MKSAFYYIFSYTAVVFSYATVFSYPFSAGGEIPFCLVQSVDLSGFEPLTSPVRGARSTN
jgi:hypothetical protein